MELHFIILITLSAILLLFIILAIIAYCCGDFCCGCGNTSYSTTHSRGSFHNETATTSTKTSSKGEYHSDQYSNNGKILSTLMHLPQTVEVDEDHSTPLLTKEKDLPKPLGFIYSIDTPQQEVTKTSRSNEGFYYPPSDTVATISYPASQRTPYQRDPDVTDISRHVETTSYAAYPPTKQINSAVVEVNGITHSVTVNSHQFASKAPLQNQNTHSSTQIRQTTALEKIPYQPEPVNIETLHHVKTASYIPYPPSKQIYSSDIEANQMPHPVVTNSHLSSLPAKKTSHSETQFSKTVVKSAPQRLPNQQDPAITETSHNVETGLYAPSSKNVYSSETERNEVSNSVAHAYRYAPTKNTSYSLDSEPTETAYFTRSGSCPPSDITTYESTTRNFYPSESRRNQTYSARTVTHSSEDIASYPISIKVANSVELIPSLDSEVLYYDEQTQMGKSSLKKPPSQVSLYDNM